MKDFVASYYKSAPSKHEKVVTVETILKEIIEEPVVKNVFRIETETKRRLIPKKIEQKIKPKSNSVSATEKAKAESMNTLMSILMNDSAALDDISNSMGGELSAIMNNGNYNYGTDIIEPESVENNIVEPEYEEYEEQREICDEVTEYIKKEVSKKVYTDSKSLCYKMYNSDLVVNKSTSVNTILNQCAKI